VRAGIPATWDAVGYPLSAGFAYAAAGLNRVSKATTTFSLRPALSTRAAAGDLITVTYAKENLTRTPFRILKVSAGPSFRTAVINAQYHDDDWYSIPQPGLLAYRLADGDEFRIAEPVIGTVTDAYGNLSLA